MNLKDPRYNGHLLVQEMMQSIDVVKHFDPQCSAAIAAKIMSVNRLMLAGEGSSRIFPAKHAVRKSLGWGTELCVRTEGCYQAAGYDLSDFAVLCTSNSGRTREVVMLAKGLAAKGHERCYGLTAHHNTLLEKACRETFILRCGGEKAVAATKSVIEQALFYESILWHVMHYDRKEACRKLSAQMRDVLTASLDKDIVARVAGASTVYFAGFNDGVAEELALKANEIAGKKSAFLEGTYAVHGVEEVLTPDDVVIVIDPIGDEIAKFEEVLVMGAGINVIAIADRPTPFRTILVPQAGDLNPYLFLCAGWSLLVEAALTLGCNIDQPRRARKIGNELKP